MIETNRLKLYPASREAMEALIARQTDEGLQAAYTEMLQGCLAHPAQWDWYAVWMLELKNGEHVGELSFKGLDADGVAEIGYGVSPDYAGRGYATEAVSAVVEWAARQPGVQRIEAETEAENAASRNVLEKCGFTANGSMGAEGPRFTWAGRASSACR